MTQFYQQLASSDTWAISLDSFVGEESLLEAIESESPAIYRKKIHSLSMMTAVKDAMEHGKNIVFFTTTIPEEPEKLDNHLDHILQGLGFLPIQAAPLKEKMVAAQSHEDIIAGIRKSCSGSTTMITQCDDQLCCAPADWKTVRVLQKDASHKEGIKNPDWFMFFMTQALNKAASPKPALA